MLAFRTVPHEGKLGRSFSLLQASSDDVAIRAIKLAEDSDQVVVRLQELNGTGTRSATLTAAAGLDNVSEINGFEQVLKPLKSRNGGLKLDFKPYQLRSLALTLSPPAKLVPPVSEPVDLPYNLDVFTFRGAQQDGAFDNEGATIPAEMIGDTVISEGIGFRVGPRENGKLNAVSCQGQTLSLPAREFNRLYLLAASARGDTDGVFRVDDRPVTLRIQNWTSPIGQWDNRVFEGDIPEMSYSITNPLERIDAGFIKRDPLAWFCSHRHLADGGDAIYSYSQLFKYRLDFPAGAKTLTLPDNPDIRVLAVTAARDDNDATQAAWPLYDDFTGRKPVALRGAAITTAGR